MPVSFRIPIPAEAKLAPTSSLCPFSSGLKYGNVGTDLIRSPESNTNFFGNWQPEYPSIIDARNVNDKCIWITNSNI